MIPTSQAQLVRLARGERSQAEFARELGVDRTCLSRYEREILGAPPSVISHCLRTVVQQLHIAGGDGAEIRNALDRAREVVSVLERATNAIARSGS
ncbi:MAG: hypothetical protein ACT4P0_05680 [Panacagrimonas sp.]